MPLEMFLIEVPPWIVWMGIIGVIVIGGGIGLSVGFVVWDFSVLSLIFFGLIGLAVMFVVSSLL